MRSYRQLAAVYDRLMEDMPYGEWLAFARTCWNRYGMPRTVVDLGCGTGNLAIPLARSGFTVFGIDLSPDMLAVARAKWDGRDREAGGASGDAGAVAAERGSVRWLQQDMRSWALPEPVDAAISFCDCLNYLTEPEDVMATFRSTYAGLAPGGLFLFDVHAPRQLERYAEEQPFVYDERGIAYLWTCDYNPEREEIRHNLTFFVRQEGDLYRRFTEQHTQRAYGADWLAAQLTVAGFEVLHVLADFKWKEPDEDAERLFFVARKPG